jgi:hypothetical protein
VHPTEWRAASALASVLPRPVRAAPPALWLTGTPLHPSDLHNVLTFEARWHAALGRPLPLSHTNTSTAADGDADAYAARADPDGYVYNSWTPAALSAAALHRAAPWLWSRAAATLFVDYALATGLLEVPSAAYLAAHGSHRPWCLRDRAFGDAPDDPVPDTTPATDVPGGPWALADDDERTVPPTRWAAGEPALFPPRNFGGAEVALRACIKMLEAEVVFRIGGRAPAEPVFLAAHELLLRPAGPAAVSLSAFARFGRGSDCVRVAASRASPAEVLPQAQCGPARDAYTALHRWLLRTLTSFRSLHDYHEPPWADIVAWMDRALARHAQLLRDPQPPP